ncbi:MAG TPA: phenylalanine--tRNA ligase subunit beta [Candidatus Babeliales bacterium]|nr:phenylalanine--tRNA ligase subunit beta [Candidatus Babeliales bacterium]
MKLSIAWIFDHIDADVTTIDIDQLVKKFNETTAEIEGFRAVSFDLETVSLAQVIAVDADVVTVHSPEWNQTYTLPERKKVAVGHWYFIKNIVHADWAGMDHFGGTRIDLLPAIHCDASLHAGGWKKLVQTSDYILDIDNKSITNRPDMWGHRGVAREIAAMFCLPLKPISDFLAPIEIAHHANHAPVSSDSPFSITLEAQGCSRFAGLYVSNITYQHSLLAMAVRFALLDIKAIDAIVDFTNYVMLDLGQPMHAFDADKIVAKTITPRMAHKQEKLQLLDGQDIILTGEDIVISDGKDPLALAGIKGGAATAISDQTTALFLESACFNASTIRRSAARHKIRTDASMRFEKTLDPNQTSQAIMRFVALLKNAQIPYAASSRIVSCGIVMPEKVIEIEHAFLQSRLGIEISQEKVIEILSRLEFQVACTDKKYHIAVPSFRSTKDVTIKEDIVEEVGRFYGYTNIIAELPLRRSAPCDVHAVYQRRAIKAEMINGLQMHELESYSFYDEDFLRRLAWQPDHSLTVLNPVSENWRQLVTSLIPNVCKAVDDNAAEYDQLRFFEWARTWQKSGTDAMERKSLAGIFFDKKNTVDFYETKKLLEQFFSTISLPITWHKAEQELDPWFAPYQTAVLKYDDVVIGIAGKANQLFLNKVVDGDAFIFELDGDFLQDYKKPIVRYVAPSKYPASVRDVSMFVPLSYTVDALIDRITTVHGAVDDVQLVDRFEKDEWLDKRALTFRFVVRDVEKTMTKDEVDGVVSLVLESLMQLGAVIR